MDMFGSNFTAIGATLRCSLLVESKSAKFDVSLLGRLLAPRNVLSILGIRKLSTSTGEAFFKERPSGLPLRDCERWWKKSPSTAPLPRKALDPGVARSSR